MTELSPIETLTFDKPLSISDDIGFEGELQWIAIDRLYIDPSYQRPIMDAGKRNIRRIVEEFNWALFAPLVVAPRGKNRYAIIDGQHKATAAKARGDIEKLPCLIVNADYAMQAKAFGVINGHVTRLHALHVFRAKAASGDPVVSAVAAICSGEGVSVAPYPKVGLAEGETLAAGTLIKCFTRFGSDVLAVALRVLMRSGGGTHLSKTAIHGMCAALAEKPEWVNDPQRLVLVFGPIGVSNMLAAAMRLKATTPGNEWTHFATVAREALEKHRDNSPPRAPMPPVAEKPKPIAPPPAPLAAARPDAAAPSTRTRKLIPVPVGFAMGDLTRPQREVLQGALAAGDGATTQQIATYCEIADERVPPVLSSLNSAGLTSHYAGKWALTELGFAVASAVRDQEREAA